MKKAIVLLSGGIDSAVTLYMARRDYECLALIFNYGQRHIKEIRFAQKIAKKAGCNYHVLDISLPWKGSALLEKEEIIPNGMVSSCGKIPRTYVPARNIIFLSYAVSFAEAALLDAVFIGAHELDYSNYPDCRSEFFTSFQEAINCGTKQGTEGKSIKIIAPLLNKTKKDIVEIGAKLLVPFEYTWSCYQGEDFPCGVCEACLFRNAAFQELGVRDPLLKVGTGLQQ